MSLRLHEYTAPVVIYIIYPTHYSYIESTFYHFIDVT